MLAKDVHTNNTLAEPTRSAHVAETYRKECLKSLAFRGVNERYLSIERDIKVEGTCSWVFQHESYQRWDGSQHGLLWVEGHPGTGKSTLMKYMIDTLPPIQDSRKTGKSLWLSFFFYGQGKDQQKSQLGCFMSLCHQLLSQRPEALSKMVDVFRSRQETIGTVGKDWDWNVNELSNYFRSGIRNLPLDSPVFVFLDALDECEDDGGRFTKGLMQGLLSELGSNHAQTRVCVSCRHAPIIEIDNRKGAVICMEKENQSDIVRYIQKRLSHCSLEGLPETQRSIVARAEGMFLWVRLVLDEVDRLSIEGRPPQLIRKHINQVPLTLDKIYSGQLKVILDDPRAIKLLQLACLAHEPLYLGSLRWALAPQDGRRYSSFDHVKQSDWFPSMDDRIFEREIKTLSCGLLECCGENEPVRFIHQTVKDFFSEKGLSVLRRPQSYQNISADEATRLAHYDLSKLCLGFLLLESDTMARQDYLVEVAARPMEDPGSLRGGYWQKSDYNSPGEPEIYVGRMKHHIFPFGGEHASWITFHDYCEYGWHYHGIRSLPKHAIERVGPAARAALTSFIEPWLERHLTDESSSVICGEHQPPGGPRAIVRWDGARDCWGNTPLCLAAYAGHFESVETMVSEDRVDVNARNYLGQTAIFLAVSRSSNTVVEALLKHPRINVNVGDTHGITPLALAVKRVDDVHIVQQLLSKGAQLSQRSGNHRTTPLSICLTQWSHWLLHYFYGNVWRSVLAVMQELLEAGLRGVEDDTSYNVIQLSAAVELRRLGSVRRLLSQGANPNALVDNAVAINRAIRSGEWVMVTTLLESGADPNMRGQCGRNPRDCAPFIVHNDRNRPCHRMRDALEMVLSTCGVLGRYDPHHNVFLERAIEAILRHPGVDINRKFEKINRRTVVSWFTVERYSSLVSVCLRHPEVDVNLRDKNGRTALHLAVLLGYEDIVKILVGDIRTDQNLADWAGRTALTMANDRERHNIAKLLSG